MGKNVLGFTFVEVLVVMGILATLLGLSSVNLITFYNKNTLTTSVDVLVSDLRQQQLLAMIGDSEGAGVNSAYGIYFEATQYTTYKGINYSSSNSFNFITKLNSDLRFSNIMFPSSQVSFASVSGEIVNYNSSFNYVTLKNISTQETKTLQLNKYGTIVNIY